MDGATGRRPVVAGSGLEVWEVVRTWKEQLEYAAEQDRVLVTRNRGDYLHWTRKFYHAGRPHSRVLFVGNGLPSDQPECEVW